MRRSIDRTQGTSTAEADKPRVAVKRHAPISVPGAKPREESENPSEQVAVEPTVDRSNPANEKHEKLDAKSPPVEIPSQPLWLTASCGLGGALLFTLSLTPLGLGQLAFLAVAPWAWLTLDARRLSFWGYTLLFACGLASWTSLSLIEINLGDGRLLWNMPIIAYLAINVPIFVLLGRLARSLLHVPAYVTLPVIWCGLEWLRCQLFGGFSLGLIAHAAADTRRILQLTDIAGSYGLGMLMVASGASVAELLWVARRIKRLEQHLPRFEESESEQDMSPFTSASQFAFEQFGYKGNRKKPTARSSMEEAMRRTRDRARDFHLVSVTLSVAVIVGVLVFANSYGQSRLDETRTWKLFESNQFAMSVLGGPDAARQFDIESKLNSKSLLVTALNRPVKLSGVRRPTLLISTATGESRDRMWDATLRRPTTEETERRPIGAGSKFAVFASDRDLPLRMLVMAVSNANIEQAVNSVLRGLPNDGQALDAVVVVIKPSWFDGSRWPRLMTRSVVAAAVANRCPVASMVPEQIVAVATGDGGLWWSSAMSTTDGAPTGDSLAEGASTSSVIQVQAMMDPRVSFYVADAGSYPALICAAITFCIPATWLWRQRRSVTNK